MHVAAACLATAIVVLVVAGQPVRGRQRYRRLVQALPHDPGARLRSYRRGIAAEWVAVGAVVAVGLLAGDGPREIGIPSSALFRTQPVDIVPLVSAAVVGLAVGTVLIWALRPRTRHQAGRMLRGAAAMLPRSEAERRTFAAVALTAGICEEVVFRGFGMAYTRWAWPGASTTEIIVVTSVVFGIAHAYQGPVGVVATGLVGAVLGWVVVATGSLLPAMLIHALVDLRILALPRSMLESIQSGALAESGPPLPPPADA
jgi:membrane protease YdiL (CAAX protease family)